MSSAASTGSRSPEQMQAAIASLSSPDRVESPFGRLDFFDGVPTPDTTATIYDALDLMRGIEVFMNSVPGASVVAMRRGLRAAGVDSPNVIGYTDPRANSESLFLTPSTETTYGTTTLDLRAWGPTVIEAPPQSLCVVDDSGFATSPTWGSLALTTAPAANICSCRPATTARPRAATTPTSPRRSPTGWCSERSAASQR